MGFIRKSIPNTITSMNLLSGAIGVILCLGGDVRTAFLLMLASATSSTVLQQGFWKHIQTSARNLTPWPI